MRIKLVTIVTTFIETNATLEEARKEILPRLYSGESLDSATEDTQSAHSSAVCFDEVISSQVVTELVTEDE